MPRPWIAAQHRRDGRSGGCWSAWLRYRDTHVASGPQAQGQEALEPLGFQDKIAKMKDGTIARARDLDTGAVGELHPADEGDTTTLPKTLAAAEANLEAVDVAPTAEDPAESDKGYHSRLVLKALDDGWKSRISGAEGFCALARRGSAHHRGWPGKPSSCAPRSSSAPLPNRGGMRGRENVHKRYLLHVAGHNLSLLMRQLNPGRPWRAELAPCSCLLRPLEPSWSYRPHRLGGWRAICFAVA